MIVFSGLDSDALATRIAETAGFERGKAEIRKFPDGEIYLRVLSEVKDKSCCLVQSLRSSDSVVLSLLFLNALADLGAKSVYAAIPYLGYARQDRMFKEGEAISAKTILRTLGSLCDGPIVTVNCHFLRKGGRLQRWGVELENLDAFPLLAKHLRGEEEATLVAPDEGARSLVEAAAEELSCDVLCLTKERISDHEVSLEAGKGSVEGVAIVLDDIISTGGTILKAVELLRKLGARKVVVGCVHGVFAKGWERIMGKVDRVVCTDTLPTEFSEVSVAGLIARALKELS